MARKKKKGGKRRVSWVDRIFEALGIIVAASPAIEAAAEHIGDPQNIPAQIEYNYIGIDGEGNFSWQQAVKGLSRVAGGGGVAAIPSIYRKVRNFLKGRR